MGSIISCIPFKQMLFLTTWKLVWGLSDVATNFSWFWVRIWHVNDLTSQDALEEAEPSVTLYSLPTDRDHHTGKLCSARLIDFGHKALRQMFLETCLHYGRSVQSVFLACEKVTTKRDWHVAIYKWVLHAVWKPPSNSLSYQLHPTAGVVLTN